MSKFLNFILFLTLACFTTALFSADKNQILSPEILDSKNQEHHSWITWGGIRFPASPERTDDDNSILEGGLEYSS